MPLVEFRCKNCGYRQEKILKYVIAKIRCENCSKSTHRVMSAPAAHFKGPGFHCNDYPKPDTGGAY